MEWVKNKRLKEFTATGGASPNDFLNAIAGLSTPAATTATPPVNDVARKFANAAPNTFLAALAKQPKLAAADAAADKVNATKTQQQTPNLPNNLSGIGSAGI